MGLAGADDDVSAGAAVACVEEGRSGDINTALGGKEEVVMAGKLKGDGCKEEEWSWMVISSRRALRSERYLAYLDLMLASCWLRRLVLSVRSCSHLA